jgi:hypothetical protein
LNYSNPLVLLVFIGNEKIGINLINKIMEYKKIENELNVAFCFHKNIYKRNSKELKKMIKDNYKIFDSKYDTN